VNSQWDGTPESENTQLVTLIKLKKTVPDSIFYESTNTTLLSCRKIKTGRGTKEVKRKLK
jgi:hypothetical protein